MIVRTDPFEDVESVRFRMDDEGHVRMGSDEVIDRARSAFEDTRHRGVTDAEIEALLERIETVPGAAEHALVHGSPAYRSAFGAWVNSAGREHRLHHRRGRRGSCRAVPVRRERRLHPADPAGPDPDQDRAASKNPVRQIATVVQGIQNVWHGVTVGNVTSYWTAEATAMTDGNPTFGNPAITASKMTAYLPGSFEIFEDSAPGAAPRPDRRVVRLPGVRRVRGRLRVRCAERRGHRRHCGDRLAGVSDHGRHVHHRLGGGRVQAPQRDPVAVRGLGHVDGEQDHVQHHQADVDRLAGSYFWTDFNDAVGSPLLGSPVKKSSSMVSAVTTGSNLIVLGDFSQYIVFDRIGTVVEFMPIVTNSSGLPTGQRALVAHKRVGATRRTPTPSAS